MLSKLFGIVLFVIVAIYCPVLFAIPIIIFGWMGFFPACMVFGLVDKFFMSGNASPQTFLLIFGICSCLGFLGWLGGGE